jgi:uroporphyrinogen-III decarboxylase
MSFEDGWAAINLEMPGRIPRSVMSAHYHWELVRAVTGLHGFVFEPLTDLAPIVEKYGQTHVILGNADTRILLLGTKAQIRAEVERCISLGRDCPGYFLGVTNCIAHNSPVESALHYNQVYEELSCR